ncbi:hypothetical protein MKX54_17155 [Alkalihalobacillus sp. FSL R5-0424]
MQKCPKCNHLNKNQTFCSKCGTKLPEPVTTSTGKTPMSKKTITLAAAGVGVVVLATAFIFTGKAMADKEKVLDSFVEALNEGNVSKVKKHLASSNKDLKVTDQHAESLIAYMQQDEDAFVGLEGKWGMESGTFTEWDLDSDFYYYSYYEDFPVAYDKVGKTWLFFDKYAFVLEATDVYVQSDTPNLKLAVDGETVDWSYDEGSYSIGEYLPGIYKLTGEVENDFGVNEKEIELNVYNDSFPYIGFDLKSATYVMDNYIDGTKLILEDIEKELDVTSGYFEFGPLLTDGTVSYHIESDTPFGTLSSETTTINDSTINATLAPNDDLKEELKNTISKALLSMRTAFQEQDKQKLESLSEGLLEETEDLIDYSIRYEEYYAGYLNQIGIDWSNAEVFPMGTSWKAIVPVQNIWEQSWYDKGNTPNIEIIENAIEYELIYSENGWKITTEHYTGGIEPTETLTFTREEQDEVSSTETAVSEEKKLRLTKGEADSLIGNFVVSYESALHWSLLEELDRVATNKYIKSVEDIVFSEERGLDESFITAEILNLTENEDGSYNVQSEDSFSIVDEDKTKFLHTTYKVIYDEERELWLVDEVLEKKEVSNNDL